MIAFTDNVAFAESLVKPSKDWSSARLADFKSGLRELAAKLFSDRPVFFSDCNAGHRWSYAYIVADAPSSQYDALVDLCRENVTLPDGIVCLSGSGRNFHGQKRRPWIALEGNIHLTAFFAPHREIERYGVAFSILAAVALVETIDSLEGMRGRAQIKWVNDVFIEGAKVAGFLVHTSSIDRTVLSAILGIGLNVARAPELLPDPFAARAAALRDFHREPEALDSQTILSCLLDRLSENYDLLLSRKVDKLLALYRKRSLVLGRRVHIWTDPEDGKAREEASGRVTAIGEDLELWLAGHEDPVTKGRLILDD